MFRSPRASRSKASSSPAWCRRTTCARRSMHGSPAASRSIGVAELQLLSKVSLHQHDREPAVKAYLVLDFTIHDLAPFREYIEKVPAFIRKHGGNYIVQGAEPTPMEGD